MLYEFIVFNFIHNVKIYDVLKDYSPHTKERNFLHTKHCA